MPSRYSFDMDSDSSGGSSGAANPLFGAFPNVPPLSNSNTSQGDPKKPCRACMDFKTWRKQQEQSSKHKESGDLTQQQRSPNNCPLDKDQLGQHTWGFLHTMAAYYPDKPSPELQKDMGTFFDILSKFYPCEMCATDMAEQLKLRPPATSSQSSLSQWLCWLHNGVNQKLGKPQFDCGSVTSFRSKISVVGNRNF
uniref:Sulfhydryl oxidase n=1 Tax=Cacopsylla melanoneura TaxID=428564 RepID=A0A8D8WIX2_9HEMI